MKRRNDGSGLHGLHNNQQPSKKMKYDVNSNFNINVSQSTSGIDIHYMYFRFF